MRRRKIYYGPMRKTLAKVIEFNRKHKKDGIFIDFTVSNVDVSTSLTLFITNQYRPNAKAVKYLWEDDFFETAYDLEKWTKEKISA